MSAKPYSTKQAVFVAVTLALVIFAVYAQTLGFGLTNYDDPGYIGERENVLTGLSVENVKWAFTTTYMAYYQPLLWLSYQLDATIYGDNFGGFHATNVLLYIATVLLFFKLLLNMTGSLWRSAAVAAFFALHPLRAESVSWLTERKDLVSGLIGMLALLAYVHYARRPSVLRFISFTLVSAIGLLAKPILVTWPAVMLLLDVWPLRRVKWIQNETPTIPSDFAPAAPTRLILEKIPLAIVCLISGYFTSVQSVAFMDLPEIARMPDSIRIPNIPVSYARYLGITFWPFDLSPHYPPRAWEIWQVVGSIVLVLSITAGFFLLRRTRPYLLIGWLWYAGTLVPVIGLTRFGTEQPSIADRYQYIPHMGLFIAIVWTLAELPIVARFRHQVAAASLVLLIAMAAISYRQSLYWRDSETLWLHSISVTQNNAKANQNLAHVYASRGRYDLALPYMLETARLAPNDSSVHTSAGSMLLAMGRANEAVKYFQAVVDFNRHIPGTYLPHLDLIKALKAAGREEEATAVYQALIKDPQVPQALVAAELDLENMILRCRAHLREHPNDANAHTLLGVALARTGDMPAAIREFETALKINPNLTDARDNLTTAQKMRSKTYY